VAALDHGGTWRFADLAHWAHELAHDGFALDAVVAAGIDLFAPFYERWPSSTAIFGHRPPIGGVLRQPDLADVIGELITADCAGGTEQVRRAFYEGAIAEQMVGFVAAQDGFMTLDDLATYRANVEPAVTRRYRNLTLGTNPTWSQGPMLLQTMAILERFDIGSLPPGSADLLHLVAEATTLAAADRERFYGDPRFVDVPIDRLLSHDHARTQAARIAPDCAQANLGPDPAGSVRSTTHLSVIDAAGNAFSVAPSDTLSLGPICPGLGFVVSPRGVQSRLDPSHPAALGPGRRPRITPAPVLALDDDGNPWALSCPGGDVIVQAMVQALVNAVDHGMDAQHAVEAPRICTMTFPNSFHPHAQLEGQLCAEARIDETVRADLGRRGHRVQDWPEWEFDAGSVALVRRLPEGTLEAGADPRRAAYAAGR
jgi:gamma-glutamyltranspeptidase / glutathione hydrolase